MLYQSGPLITEDALDRIAHRWLATVRAEQPKEFESKSRGDIASYGTLLDWLLDVDDPATGNISVD